jgi:prepilin signal peptidase PulO-like enzyme (type II secretory pathway)
MPYDFGRVPLAFAAGAAVGGWLVGLVSAWLTELLQRQDGLPAAGHGPLVRDALVQGSLAVVWAVLAFRGTSDGPEWRWLVSAAVAVPIVQVAITDLRHRYVYTAVAVIGLVLGLAAGWLLHGNVWWQWPAGAIGGLVFFLVLYVVGRLAYRGQEPLARGDITIATMIGGIAGPQTATALVLGILFSGLFAVGVLIARRSRHVFLPYGPGLCLGGLVTLLMSAS